MDLPNNLSKNKDECGKAIKKSKLAFNNPVFEMGNLTGYEYKIEQNSTCQGIKSNQDVCLINETVQEINDTCQEIKYDYKPCEIWIEQNYTIKDYNQTCMEEFYLGNITDMDECITEEIINNSYQSFDETCTNNLNQMNCLIDVERETFNNTCLDNLNSINCNLNVSYPIYSWEEFKDIPVNLPENFLAIDDVDVGACGTLSTANIVYNQNNSIVQTSDADCIIINAQNITFNGNGYSITSVYNRTGVQIHSLGINGTVINTNISMGRGSGGFAIEVKGNNCYVRNNTLINNRFGMEITGGGAYCNIINNTIDNSGIDCVLCVILYGKEVA